MSTILYNYQDIRNRLKRDLWALIAINFYIFKKGKKSKTRAIIQLFGERPEDFIEWVKSDTILHRQREMMYSLPGIKVHNCFFHRNLTQFKRYNLSKDVFLVGFPHTYKGMKMYFNYVYEVNPQFIQPHDPVIDLLNSLLIKWVMGVKMIFFARGMNYYEDFVFRDKSTLSQWFRAHYNKLLYKTCIKSSFFVDAPIINVLEMELLSSKKLNASDFLLCQGAISVQIRKNKKIIPELSDLNKTIGKYNNKIFTFSRVEKIKIDGVIKNYLNIHRKIYNSCLVIIGDGSAMSYYKRKYLKHKNIIFTGWIDKNDAFSFIENFDLMIAPNGGYSLIEAGFLGVPTVAYNYNVMSDLIYNKFNGYLIDQTHPEEIEQVIIDHFKKDKETLLKIKQDVKCSYDTRFNLDVLKREKEKISDKLFFNK
jgi:glycosyltransferase involved in cell wall biosynthesis